MLIHYMNKILSNDKIIKMLFKNMNEITYDDFDDVHNKIHSRWNR